MLAIRLLYIFLLGLSPLLIYGTAKDSISIRKAEFSENKGQWPKQVLFKTALGNGNLWLEKSGFRFDIYSTEDVASFSHHNHDNNSKLTPSKNANSHNYYLNFIHADSNVKIIGQGEFPDYENYFLGNNPEKWASNIHKYSIVSYESLYQGIDLKIYESSNKLKWDFIIEAGSDPSDILIEYQGVDKIYLKNGNLNIETSVNTIIELAPMAYQFNESGQVINIDCKYKLSGNQVSFLFPDDFDHTKKLIIDPTLIFGSYTGSLADNWGYTATYDSHGFLYTGGIVFGINYPTTLGAMDTTFNGVVDVSITKFDTTGTSIIYSTYLGGSAAEVPASLIVNSLDELLVLGTTASLNFPTNSSSYDVSFNGGTGASIISSINFVNGSDLFITHFNHAGTQLIGSTYFGGNQNDGINSATILVKNYGDDIRGEIMVDKNNNIYVVSTTQSTNLPTSSSVIQPTKGLSNDGMIAKFDNSLSNLIWATYFGGNGNDALYGIKINTKQDIYITGGTSSTNLPTTSGSFQPIFQGGNTDGFVFKIDKSGQSIPFGTYIGSAAYDQTYLLDLDRYNNVYLFGQTEDTSNVFIYNALWNSPKDGQFIIKLNPSLSSRIWSTTWGNGVAGIDVVPSAFMVDLCNSVYLSAWGGNVNHISSSLAGGYTTNLPITTNALQSSTNGSDYYLMVMADDASALSYGSFYGGTSSAEHVDGGTSRFDNKGRVYQSVCAGCGSNDDFPTTSNAYSTTNNSFNCNNGVFKIDFNIPAIVADYIIPPVLCLPDSFYFENTSFLSHPNLTQYQWSFGDGTSSYVKSPYHTYIQSGIYDVRLVIYDPQSCNLRDTSTQQVIVLSNFVDTLNTVTLCLGDNSQIGILPVNDTSVHFLWTPPNSLSSTTISNPYSSPFASIWYKMVMSNSICADTFYQQVEVLNLQADAGSDTSVCSSAFSLIGHGNAPNLNYHWSSNAYFTDTLNNYPSNVVNSVFTQPHYLYLKVERNGCWSIDSVYITMKIIITTANIQNPLCYGDSTGSIALNVQGGKIPYTYSWNNGLTTNPILNITGGNYSLTVTDADGCLSTFDTLLTEPNLLTSQSDLRNIPCQTACIGKAWANPQGGTPPFQWQWNDPSNQISNPAIQLCDGIYQVTITDANNCIAYDTIELIDSSIYINFNAWADLDTIYENQQVGLHSTQLGSGYNYVWTPSTGLSDPNISDPTATLTSTTTFTINVTDAFGCTWQDQVTIYVTDVICEEPYIYVPNAFTPNQDGKNDILYVESSVGYELQFMIYDRWGELVFETNDLDQGWDGRFKGKLLSPGVYVYHLKFTCYSNEIFTKKGNITLIR